MCYYTSWRSVTDKQVGEKTETRKPRTRTRTRVKRDEASWAARLVERLAKEGRAKQARDLADA